MTRTRALYLVVGAMFYLWPVKDPAVASEKILANRLHEDFQILRHALETGHGGIYRYTTKKQMDRAFRDARRSIEAPMTDLELAALAPVVARIKCGHTYLGIPESVSTHIQTVVPAWPLDIELFDHRVFVVEDFTGEHEALVGAELLAINGTPVPRLLRTIESNVTGDGDSRTARAYRVPRYGIWMYGLYSLGVQSPFRIVFRDRSGKRGEAEVAGRHVSGLRAEELRRHPEPTQNAELQFLDDGAIAVLTIRHWYLFVDAECKLSFSNFLVRSFEEIRRRGTTDLIIDVRDNDGGADAPGKELFAFLWDRPFQYDRAISSATRWISTSSSTLPRPGRSPRITSNSVPTASTTLFGTPTSASNSPESRGSLAGSTY